MKLEREALAHFLDTSWGSDPAKAAWEILGEDIDDMSVDLNPDTETKENILGKETVTECEQRVIEKMDYLMGADTGSTFFSILGPFSPMANGKLFVEVCMDTLRDVINKEFDVRIKRTQSRVSKYTQKYQQHKPNYTKKRRRHG